MEQSTRALQGQDTTPVLRHCEPEQQRQRGRTTTAARPWVLCSLQQPGPGPTAALQTKAILQRSRPWGPRGPAGAALYAAVLQVLPCFSSRQLPQMLAALISRATKQHVVWALSSLFLSAQPCSLGVPTLCQAALGTEHPDPPLSLCFTRWEKHIPDTIRQCHGDGSGPLQPPGNH